jgi:TRAP-type C4-dicarboxylate transport system permease small subunit
MGHPMNSPLWSKVMGKHLRFIDEHLEEYVASALFVVFSTLMFVNVIMRYVFQDAIPWAEEMTLLCFVWFVWFAIPFSTKLDNHARVSFIQDLFPDRIKAVLNILLSVMTIALFVIIIVSGIQYLGHSAVRGKTGLLVAYPMWVFYIPAPLGLILTVYRLLEKLGRDFNAFFLPSATVSED